MKYLKIIVSHKKGGYSWKKGTGYEIISVEYLEAVEIGTGWKWKDLNERGHCLDQIITDESKKKYADSLETIYEYIIDIEKFKKSYEIGHSFY